MKFRLLTSIALTTLLLSCNGNEKTSSTKTAPDFQNKGHELVYHMVQKVGNYSTLVEKKDVVYTYTYQTPDGQADISTEKYLFDGELSYGKYTKHQRTFPDLEGSFEQGFDGSNYWLKHEGKHINDTTRLKRVAFNRPTNFYWFAMFQKLLDPGIRYEHLGETKRNGKEYDIVKISFITENDKPTDIYQLYLNKKTGLVDEFLFTVADFGVMEIPNLMQLKYTKIDGMLIPSQRRYKKSTWNADVSDAPWINVTWSDIRFNNDLDKSDFKK